jgi:hypothetical protein
MRSKDTLTPHIAIPFTMLAGGVEGVDVNEQDTLDDVYDCTQAIIRCPEGYRPELMAFGIPDQTFSESEIDLSRISDKVALWEPRADTLYSQAPGGITLLEDLVKVRVARLSQSGGSSA